MADGGRQDVLGQKAQAAQRAFEARGMSPSKALRRALSRAADVLWDLALVVHSVSVEALDQDGVVDNLSDERMLLLLDGPDGAIGLAEMDREVVTGIVEVQTIQQVTNMPSDDRPMSATDAAMMAPLVDNAMERFASYLVDSPLLPQLSGFRFGAMIEDARTASHILDAPSYRAFRADLDLALGRRTGRISFLLPERRLADIGAGDAGTTRPGPHEDDFMRVPVRLDCMLARITIPLHQAEKLRPGDVLPLSDQILGGAELRAAKGRVVAGGRLGQLNGMRALRLLWPNLAPGADAALALPEAEAGLAQIPDFSNEEPASAMDFASALPDISETAPPEPEGIDFAADAAAFDMGEFSDDFDGGGMGEFDGGLADENAADDAEFGAEANEDFGSDDFSNEDFSAMDFDFKE